METGDLNHATTRNRTFAVGKRIEQEICDEMDHPRLIPSQPSEWWWGSMAHSLKRGILERARGISLRSSQRGGEAFAMVPDLDEEAKRRVQRFCGDAIEDTALI